MKGQAGPMRKFGEKKASPQSNRARSHSKPSEESRGPSRGFSRDAKPDNRKSRDRPSYGSSRDDKPKRTYGRSREEPREKPRRTYGKDREEDGQKRFSRTGPSRRSSSEKPEGRGRKMSNRARALKDTSMGFKKFSREPDKKKPRRDYKVICANCGKQTDVPFKPTGVKPVYCKDCYQKNN